MIVPLLSIVIPVYNIERYIDECICSILNQDFTDYEIILVNDASTDNSGAICDSYALKYSNIKVIHLEVNSLLGAARNVGLNHATGQYIHFCDGDDYYFEGSLTKIGNALKATFPTVLVGQFICVPEKGAFVCKDQPLDPQVFEKGEKACIIEYLLRRKNLLHSACRVISKREFLISQQLTFLEGYYAEDEEWFPKVMCSADSFALLSDPFYCYRPRASGSITSRKTYLHSKSQLKASISLLHFLYEKKYTDYRREYILSRVRFLLGLFATRCGLFSSEQLHELATMIECNIEPFKTIMEIPETHTLYDFISRYGSYMGLCLYKTYIMEKTLEIVYEKENAEIYVFPTGYNGEGTAQIIKNAGYHINGFLDNSHLKSECVIDGLPVNLPATLKKLPSDKFKNIFVLVTSQQEDTSKIIMEQLRELGLKDTQFASRIY